VERTALGLENPLLVATFGAANATGVTPFAVAVRTRELDQNELAGALLLGLGLLGLSQGNAPLACAPLNGARLVAAPELVRPRMVLAARALSSTRTMEVTPLAADS